MDWEIGLQELPENIRHKLHEIKDAVNDLNWQDIKQFSQAEEIWRKAESFVMEKIEKNQN